MSHDLSILFNYPHETRRDMMKKPLAIYDSLPVYFGGKRKLNPKIFGTLKKYLPRHLWQHATFIDAFCGGGSVSLAAKAYGFGTVISNDCSDRSHLVMKALLANQALTLDQYHVLSMMKSQTAEIHPNLEGFVGTVFSERHAKALSQVLFYTDEQQDEILKSLFKLLCWRLVSEYVAFGTSIGTSNKPFAEVLDGKRDWYSLNPKRLTDKSFGKLLKPAFLNVEKHRHN